MEHRWGRRVPVQLNVGLRIEPLAATSAVMRDISVSGAFIATPLPPPVFSQVHVELMLTYENRQERYELPAYVVRHTADGIGIEWAELAPAAICRQLRLSETGAAPSPDKSISNPQRFVG